MIDMNELTLRRMDVYRKESRDVAHKIDKAIGMKLELRQIICYLENESVDFVMGYIQQMCKECDENVKNAELEQEEINRAYSTTLAAWREM